MIVTSFSAKGYREYGKRCIESFIKHWRDEELIVYYERVLPDDAPKADNVRYVDMLTDRECRRFINVLERSDPIFRGIMRHPQTGQQAYNFHLDAYKFFRKAVVIAHAGRNYSNGKLYAWLDADTVFEKDVPAGFLSSVLPDDSLCARLERTWLYTESGFVVFNPESDDFELFLKLYVDTYYSGAFRLLTEFHDCYVLDLVLSQLGAKTINLSPNDSSNHPFQESVIGKYAKHLKGPKRKEIGDLLETDPR